MSWTPWKAAEKQVSEFFGGKRRVRINYSDFAGDIEHPRLAIEVKQGKQIPSYLNAKFPTVIRALAKSYVIYPAHKTQEMVDVIKSGNAHCFETRVRKDAKFLLDGLRQASAYPENTGKIPILAMKPPRCRGFIVAMSLYDWFDLYL